MNQSDRKYEEMSDIDLEEILRQDYSNTDHNSLSSEEILAILNVLSKRERSMGKIPKTPESAFQEFQEKYLNGVRHEKQGYKASRNAHDRNRKCFRAVAAIFLVVTVLSVSAHSMGVKWSQVFFDWTPDSVSMVQVENGSQPLTEGNNEDISDSLEDSMMLLGLSMDGVPEYFEKCVLNDIVLDETPARNSVFVVMSDEKGIRFKFSAKNVINGTAEQIEKSSDKIKTYSLANGNEAYLIEDNDQYKAVWFGTDTEYYISGEMSLDDIKFILDSIK